MFCFNILINEVKVISISFFNNYGKVRGCFCTYPFFLSFRILNVQICVTLFSVTIGASIQTWWVTVHMCCSKSPTFWSVNLFTDYFVIS